MIFAVIGFWSLGAHAQFGFFDQMFNGGGQQQQQQPQNVRSDSSWYQSQYENGTVHPLFSSSPLPTPTSPHLIIPHYPYIATCAVSYANPSM